MIAFASQTAADCNDRFVQMLPTIRRIASYAFRRVRACLREELVTEVVANALVAFKKLVQRGKADLAYATVLAKYAIKQIRDNRRVGANLNSEDVMHPHAQRRRHFVVLPLQRQRDEDRWEDLVVEDRNSTPAEIAACRLDFRAWLKMLDQKKRAMVMKLASGEPTITAARIFKVSQGRISQLRQELKKSWQFFQGEL